MERRRQAWWPLFGLIVIVIFGGFSWFIAPEVMPRVEQIPGFALPDGVAGQAIVAFVIFVLLFGVGMTIITILGGGPKTDPRDVRTPSKKMAKEMKQSTRKKSRY